MAPEINREKCIGCGGCVSICPVDAIELKNKTINIDEEKCIECGKCVEFCPAGALKLKK